MAAHQIELVSTKHLIHRSLVFGGRQHRSFDKTTYYEGLGSPFSPWSIRLFFSYVKISNKVRDIVEAFPAKVYSFGEKRKYLT